MPCAYALNLKEGLWLLNALRISFEFKGGLVASQPHPCSPRMPPRHEIARYSDKVFVCIAGIELWTYSQLSKAMEHMKPSMDPEVAKVHQRGFKLGF